MFFYIKEWADGTATLMAKNGAVLWTFPGVGEAQQVCRDWYQVHEESVDCYVDGIGGDIIDLDESYDDDIDFDSVCAVA